jgi:ankyrin repeat protein
LAECYRKLGQEDAAREQFQRLLRQFPDQSPFAELSRAYLRTPAPAPVDEAPNSKALTDVVENGKAYHPGGEEEARTLRRLAGLAKGDPDLLNAGKSGGEETPLQTAARLGQLAVAEYLLGHGAGPDDAGYRGAPTTPALALAALHGRTAMVELLLAHKAGVNAATPVARETPLSLAASSGYKNVMEVLLAHGADVNAKNEAGDTPLHEATGFESACEMLLSKGANPNARNKRGQTPLMIAVGQRRYGTARLLLAHQADPNQVDNAGLAVLRYAAYESSKDLCEMLLTAGARVDIRNRTGRTLLHGLAERGDEELMEYFLAHGAGVNARDKTGRTPLHYALAESYSGPERSRTVRLLVSHHADVTARDEDGRTPLHALAALAREDTTVDMAGILVANGAAVDAEDNNGNTPLWFAILKPDLELIRFLLSNHANPDIADGRGRSTLHRLSMAEFSGWGQEGPAGVDRLIELLLAHKATMNAKDRDGRTPLHLAVLHSQFSQIRILLENGADVNAKDNAGRTAVDLLEQSPVENREALKALFQPRATAETTTNAPPPAGGKAP